MRLAQHRLEAAGQRLIRQHRVEIHGRPGHGRLTPGRDRRMQIGQRLPRHRAMRIPANPSRRAGGCGRCVEKAAQDLAGVGAFAAFASLVEKAFRLRGVFGRRQEQEGQEVDSKCAPPPELRLRSASTIAEAMSGKV